MTRAGGVVGAGLAGLAAGLIIGIALLGALLAYHGVAEIGALAGVNVALVYRYFAGKEAIVGALIERHADKLNLGV